MTITVGSGVHVSSSNLSAPFIGTATSVGTTATVTYTVPATDGGVPIQYYVATSSPGNLTGTANQAGSGSVAVSGLTLSQPYTFTVQAYNWFGLSPSSTASNTVTPAIAPCAPFIGTATATGGTSATVSYTAPIFNGGAAITSYVAASSPGSITATLSQAGSGTITVTGLTQGTPYSFSVRAVNRIGPGAASTASNIITLFSAPCAPTIGTATATGQTSATVAFTVPANNGGAAITKYIATSSPGSITATLSQAGSGTITVTGLTGLTAYTFTVTATSSVGTGSASSASNSITTWRAPGSCSYTSPGTYSWAVPSGVYSVSAVVVGGGSASGRLQPGAYKLNRSGSGGGLAYKNNVTVTPGTYVTVYVGKAGTYWSGYSCSASASWSTISAQINGGDSSAVFSGGTLKATGGNFGGCYHYASAFGGGPCGSFHDGGGTGGGGQYGCCYYYYHANGGGGAGGYSGNGGQGGYSFGSSRYSCGNNQGIPLHGNVAAQAGSGGGGGGGGGTTCLYGTFSWTLCARGGGGVGIFGQGCSGTAGRGACNPSGGGGGSGGCSGSYRAGGKYGGGAGLAYNINCYGGVPCSGANGAVRIMWPGSTRQFPSTCASSP